MGTRYSLKGNTNEVDGSDLTAINSVILVSDGDDHTASAISVTATAGENLVFGEVCYLKSDGKFWKSNADASTTMPVKAMALATINADASGSFLLIGITRDDSWSWTIGGLIYASCTTGALTQTAPSGSGDQVQIVGWALTATIMYFNPSYEMVEVA